MWFAFSCYLTVILFKRFQNIKYFIMMDDSQKSLKYLIAVEKLAEEILSDKRNIVLLDKRRNENREAFRIVQNQNSDKCWLTVGSNVIKCERLKAIEFIEKDMKQLDVDISKLRSELKIKVNKLRDLEHEPPVPGLMLVPLSQDETKGLGSVLKYT